MIVFAGPSDLGLSAGGEEPLLPAIRALEGYLGRCRYLGWIWAVDSILGEGHRGSGTTQMFLLRPAARSS
jgi:hypothetical protein